MHRDGDGERFNDILCAYPYDGEGERPRKRKREMGKKKINTHFHRPK